LQVAVQRFQFHHKLLLKRKSNLEISEPAFHLQLTHLMCSEAISTDPVVFMLEVSEAALAQAQGKFSNDPQALSGNFEHRTMDFALPVSTAAPPPVRTPFPVLLDCRPGRDFCSLFQLRIVLQKVGHQLPF
jgi:hypothetical protein